MIDLQPGYQKLNGADALDYVRYRHLDSDFFRIARQQQFLRGIKQRATDFPLIDLPKLVKTLTSNVEVGKGDGTRFDARTLLDYAAPRVWAAAASCDPDEDRPELLPGSERGHGDPVVCPGRSQRLRPARRRCSAQGDGCCVEPSPRRSAPPPSQTTVTVLNGNGQVGSATSAASQLGGRGYKIVTSGDGNAPSWEYFRTEVYYQGGADARAAANKLSNLFGDARLSPIPAEIAPLPTARR